MRTYTLIVLFYFLTSIALRARADVAQNLDSIQISNSAVITSSSGDESWDSPTLHEISKMTDEELEQLFPEDCNQLAGDEEDFKCTGANNGWIKTTAKP